MNNNLLPKSSIWNKHFILACFVGLCTGISVQMLNSTLSVFANDMWQSKSLGGYLTTFFNIGSISMAFFCGPIVEKVGRRKCIVGSGLLFGLPTLLIIMWPTPAVSLAVRFVQGVAKGIVVVAATCVVSDVTPRNRMGEGVGLYGLGNTFSMALGPMLALTLTANGSYGLMFFVCAMLYILAGGFGLGINYESSADFKKKHAARSENKENSSSKQYRGIWKFIEKAALIPSINWTICFASYACVMVFITVYAQEILGFSSPKISYFYTIAAIIMLLIRIFASKLSDKYGVLSIVVPGHICILVMLFLLAFFAKSYVIFLLCGALYGVANAAIMPAMNAAAIVDSPASRSGAANATFYFLMDFGILFSSTFFGGVIDKAPTLSAGYRNMFLMSGGICCLSMLMAITLLNNKARAKRRPASQVDDE